jgi:hypothetical protein
VQAKQYARVVDYLDHQIRRAIESRRGVSISVRGVWLASSDVKFTGVDGYSGVFSHYKTFLRGDLKITAFLRDLCALADDENVQVRLLIFVTILLAAAELAPEQAGTYAAAQLRRIKDEIGGDDLSQGNEAFLDAINSSSSLRRFDTAVWVSRGYSGY